jgi:hypothetical protein
MLDCENKRSAAAIDINKTLFLENTKPATNADTAIDMLKKITQLSAGYTAPKYDPTEEKTPAVAIGDHSMAGGFILR